MSFILSFCISIYVEPKQLKLLEDDVVQGSLLPETTLSRRGDKAPKPMKNNEVQSFIIDSKIHKNCKLVDKEGETVKKYNVKKTRGEGFILFTASIDTEFNEDDIKNWFLGISNCKAGFIESVRVSSGGANSGAGSDTSNLNAVRCGIGTMLSALCMIDKDVNPGNNIALDLERYFRADDPSDRRVTNAIDKAKQDCKNVVGLQMSAAPGGGNIYFRAAQLAGYNRMMFFDEHGENEWIWLDTSEAQACYDDDKLGCQDDVWYFCKEKKPSSNSGTSCLRKLLTTCLK